MCIGAKNMSTFSQTILGENSHWIFQIPEATNEDAIQSIWLLFCTNLLPRHIYLWYSFWNALTFLGSTVSPLKSCNYDYFRYITGASSVTISTIPKCFGQLLRLWGQTNFDIKKFWIHQVIIWNGHFILWVVIE